MSRRNVLIIILVFLVSSIAGCGMSTKPQEKKLQVVASVYPVQEFVKAVGKDRVDVSLLVPPGTEPHDWEPTAKDLAKIKGSALLVYHGAGLEHWVGAVVKPDLLGSAKAVEASKGVALLDAAESESEDEHGHNHSGETHETKDPHVWLDPVLAQQEVKTILAALIEVDPAHASEYEANAAAYVKELQLLHDEYTVALQHTAKRELITSHAAFSYLAKRYQLQQVPVMGLSPDAEPTADKMAEIIRFCKAHQVKYIFFETLVSPKLAEVLSREAGASTLVLNPLEGLTVEEYKAGKSSYLTLMRENLQQLKKALAQ
ncbi:metal ABC transporter substrate-binding protein [Anaeromusa acidaminophila]|uniref:metal ABC transporter substrate-binding protein n=1 Tax=Anaeromusa acidaminophila TaxID=81464 RepID=UPI00036359FD|nr:metal ABC transporter substrate-binding protein [Anaeromusa acidaminophila]